jgi:hypothetical protein
MIALGIILIVIAVSVAVGVAVGDSSPAVTFELFTGQYTTSTWWVFAAGALSMLLALAGGWVLRFGIRREMTKNRELRRLREIEQRSTNVSTLLDESTAERPATSTPKPDESSTSTAARSTATRSTAARPTAARPTAAAANPQAPTDDAPPQRATPPNTARKAAGQTSRSSSRRAR